MRIIRRRYVEIIFILLAVGCGLAAVYLDVQLTYVASANTEQVKIESLKPSISQWYIESADIKISCDGEWQIFSGAILVQSPVIIAMKRIGGGPLRISIRSGTKSDDQIVAKLNPANKSTDLLAKGCLFIKINNLIERAKKGKTIVLAVNGYMEIGRLVAHSSKGQIPVLKSGKVQVIGNSLLGDHIYDAGTIALNTGDQFSVDNPEIGNGLVVVDHQTGLYAVSYTLGESAKVIRFGTKGYKVRSSLWTRFEKDPVIKALVAVVFSILGAMAAWRKWWEESNGDKACEDL